MWPSKRIVLASAFSLDAGQFRGNLRAKFEILHSYDHRVSISGQCDAGIIELHHFVHLSRERKEDLHNVAKNLERNILVP